jgi:glycosyltransferase involved in cell wall biosynthesis
MRIAFIGQKGIPAKFGGVERHVEEIAKRMAKQGHKVFVYVRNNYTPKEIREYEGIKLIHLPSFGTKHLDAISHTFFASIHAIFCKYDVVHFHAIGPSSLAWIVRFFKRKTLIVSTFHCQDYFHQKWGLFARLYLRLGEYVTCNVPHRTIVVTKTLQEYARQAYGTETIVVPNGAAVNPTKGSESLAKWNLRNKRYVLNQGRLIKHKGIHYLIEAFKQLEDSSSIPNNFKLVIVGDGFHTDDYVEYLRTISKGRENIIFTGGQTGKVMEELFSNAYMFVQPSESEGLSLSLLEAMGYGLPVLASDIKENAEPLGETGFTFHNKDVQDLREKMAYVINRPNEAQEAGKRAKQRIENEYNWDSIAARTLLVYKQAIIDKKGKK